MKKSTKSLLLVVLAGAFFMGATVSVFANPAAAAAVKLASKQVYKQLFKQGAKDVMTHTVIETGGRISREALLEAGRKAGDKAFMEAAQKLGPEAVHSVMERGAQQAGLRLDKAIRYLDSAALEGLRAEAKREVLEEAAKDVLLSTWWLVP